MKKYLLSLLCVLLLVLCVSACGSQQSSDTNDNNNSDVNGENLENKNNTTVLSVAEKRNLKVSFNIEVHHMGNLPEKDDNSIVLDRHLIAIMGENKDGNACIEYSPNAYSFYALITCQNTLNDAWEIINGQINKHFDGFGPNNRALSIDATTIGNNQIMVCFPDFHSYSLCQEDMLNGLSEKDSVLSVEVGYINAQNGTTKVQNVYEYIDVGMALEGNRHIKSYDEFMSLLGNKIDMDEELQKITAHTFENNYVFVVVNHHHREFDISDAKLIDNTVYFTTNCYGPYREIVDAIEHYNACITFVPKSELGELPQEVKVRGLEVLLLTEE